MPGTITSDLTTVNAADATTSWVMSTAASSSNGTNTVTIAANADCMVQGTTCLAATISATYFLATNVGLMHYPLTANLSGTDVHAFCWHKVNQAANLDTQANGGLRFHLSCDTTWAYPGTIYREWYISGKDTDKLGGWNCYVINPNATPVIGRSAGTFTANSVKHYTLGIKQLTSTTGIANFQDAIRYGTGLTLVNGTDEAPATFADIYTTDSTTTNAWGILTQISGIYYGAAKFRIGTASQTAVTRLVDRNLVMVWQNFPVSTTLYEFNIQGTASFNTVMSLGDYNSGIASGGCAIKGSGTTSGTSHSVWAITVGTYGAFKAYASLFSELRTATLNANCELRGCTISNFGNITPGGATISDCIFQGLKTTAPISGTAAITVSSPSQMAAITASSFINCAVAIKITAAGTYTLSGILFSGNTVDIENNSTGAVVINLVGGSSVPVVSNTRAGATTTVNNLRTLTLTGIKSIGSSVLVGSEVRIYSAGTQTELTGIEECTTGTFQYSYAYSANTYVDIVVHHPDFLYYRISNYLLGSSDASLPIQQQLDRQYFNPGDLSFSITGATTLNNGYSNTYTVPNLPGGTFAWSVASGTATISSGQGTSAVNVTSSTNNVFQLRCVITAVNGNSGTANTNVTVSNLPLTVTIAGATSMNSGTNQTFTVGAVANATYTWSITSGTASILSGQGTNSVTVTSSTTGNFTLQCVVGSPSGSGSDTHIVNVAAAAPLTFKTFQITQSNGTGGGKQQASVSVTAGDLIVVTHTHDDNVDTTACADNSAGGSNTYNAVGTGTFYASGAGTTHLKSFYAIAKATETLTISVTTTSTAYPGTSVCVISGNNQNLAQVLDVYAYDAQEGAASTAHTSAQITTTNANDIILCIWAQDTTSSGITENGAGFTEATGSVDSYTNGACTSAMYKVVTATGTYSDTVTSSASTFFGNVIMAFKKA